MTEERLKLHEKAETRINAIIDTLSQDKGGLADKLKQEDVKDFLVSLWVDCSTEATKELEKEGLNEQAYKGSILEERLRLTRQIFALEQENARLKDALEGYKQNAKWCDKCDKIADLEKKNKVLAQNLEDTEIINAELKQKYDTCLRENTGLKIHSAYVEKKLTQANELLKQWLSLCGFKVEKLAKDTEQFLKDLEK